LKAAPFFSEDFTHVELSGPVAEDLILTSGKIGVHNAFGPSITIVQLLSLVSYHLPFTIYLLRLNHSIAHLSSGSPPHDN
jgi:hypothetical protein